MLLIRDLFIQVSFFEGMKIMKSYDYEINEIMKTVHKNENLLLKLNGTTVAQEETKNSLRDCYNMLQEIRATSTVIQEEIRAYLTSAYELHEKRSTLSAREASTLYHDFIRDLLQKEKIEISDIPFQIRSTTNSFYVTAYRACRSNDFTKGRSVLNLLKDDLLLVNTADQQRLARLYEKLLYENLKEMRKFSKENNGN